VLASWDAEEYGLIGSTEWVEEFATWAVPNSVRNGLGARAAPRGNCQEDWTGPDDNFYSVPSWDILGLQGLSKDHGPHKVRQYYAVLIKGPQGTVVDCRSPDKDGGDL